MIMKNIMTGAYIKGDETFAFNFYTDLSAYDKLVFVNSVVESIVDDTSYDFIIRDLIFDFNIIRMFTDIDVSFVNSDVDDENFVNPIIPIEEFLEESNAVDIVKINMKDGLLEELNKAVDLAIEYRTGIHVNPLSDAITSLVNTIESKIKNIDLDSMYEVANIIAKNIGEISPDSIINAYINSDIYKGKVEELKEVKENK